MSTIRQYFISRWDHGYIAEYDFSQLEVIALAHLSQDENLISDIKNGLDMHCVSASMLYGDSYKSIKDAIDAGDPVWKKRRKIAKAPGFLIQYGGGAATMAEETGLPTQQCQDFIDNYYSRYKGVQAFQGRVASEVLSTRHNSGKRTDKGFPAGRGIYTSQTGRRYCFLEKDGFRGRLTNFSPTQMKNYPVQGFATGDIVPTVLGKLFRVLKNNPDLSESCLLINTVHDSVVFDVKDKETLEYAHPIIVKTMSDAPKYLKDLFNIDFNLELPVDGEAGRNWLEMQPVEKLLDKVA